MARLTDNQLKDLLDNARQSAGNHYQADCPICGKKDHFYIQRTTQLWDCKKCKSKGSIFTLLKKINKLDLLGDNGFIDYTKKLGNQISEFSKNKKISVESLVVPAIELPLGFKRVYYDSYLESREFSEIDYEEYEVGRTKLVSLLKTYVIIPVRECGKVYGYLARSDKSKEEIKEINLKHEKEETGKKYLRWRNSKGVDFSKLLYGIDEVKEGDTVIVVESFFVKRKLDRVLKLRNTDSRTKCVVTFGKSISEIQTYKILDKKVSKIVLVYDADAIDEIKEISFILQLKLKNNVYIGVLFQGEDIDNMEENEINQIFNNLKTPQQYYNNIVYKKI